MHDPVQEFRAAIMATPGHVLEAIEPGGCELRQREAGAQALAALNGIALHKFVGSDAEPVFVACKWNLSREFGTLNAVETWLAQITCADHPGRRERAQQELIDAANRAQDEFDEVVDFLRGPGGSRT